MISWRGHISRAVEVRLSLFLGITTAEPIEFTRGNAGGRESRETFSLIYISKEEEKEK
jgi:hypothetical protein